jgi:hypothetical protein
MQEGQIVHQIQANDVSIIFRYPLYQKVGCQECGRRPDWIQMDSGEACDLIEMVKSPI